MPDVTWHCVRRRYGKQHFAFVPNVFETQCIVSENEPYHGQPYVRLDHACLTQEQARVVAGLLTAFADQGNLPMPEET
jgi:hypothetical protein